MSKELIEQPDAFWNSRYQNGETGWDIGYPSPPLKAILDTLPNKHNRILIPGAGNAWEARYAWENGFTQLYVIDIAPLAVEGLRKACPQHADKVILGDFFEHEGKYNLILEQTFFCALHPSLREAYAEKMTKLLLPGASVQGVLFATAMNSDRPPYGGSATAYAQLFRKYFQQVSIAPCENSIPARANNELLIRLSEPLI